MKNTTKKICFISSAGGHLDQIKQLKAVNDNYDHFFVVTRTKITETMKENPYIVSDLNRKSKIHQMVSFAYMCIEQWRIYVKERPDVIITTGAGVAIPMCIIGKLFRQKVIYIESYARVYTPNKTGLLLYRFADIFIIQWEELREYYPDAVYGGGIY